jgi:hypothetical protein
MDGFYEQHAKPDCWFEDILTYINDKGIKEKLIKLNKEGRLTYIEHCGRLEYFDINGNIRPIEPVTLSNGKKYLRPRREHEHNLCFQYIPRNQTTEGYKYIILKIEDETI